MDEWEELEIDRDDELLPPPDGASVLPWLVWGILAVSLLLGLGYYLTRDEEPALAEAPAAAPAPPPVALEAEPPEDDVVAEPEEPPVELPPLSASDVFLREMGARLSSHPELGAFLLTDDLVRRFVVSAVNVAEGKTPRRQLGHVRPEGDFEAQRRGGRLFLDSETYRRYDLHAEVFASLDAEGVARLYRIARPLFEEAFAELGLPEDRKFESTLARAITVLLEAPVIEGPIALEAVSVNYTYADPQLERLSPAQKHLLRMGPENTRRVQSKLEEIAGALGIAARAES